MNVCLRLSFLTFLVSMVFASELEKHQKLVIALPADQSVLSAIELARQLPIPVGIRTGQIGYSGLSLPANEGRFGPQVLLPDLVEGEPAAAPVLPALVVKGDTIKQVLDHICQNREGWSWTAAGDGIFLNIDFHGLPQELMNAAIKGEHEAELWKSMEGAFTTAMTQRGHETEGKSFWVADTSFSGRDVFLPILQASSRQGFELDPNTFKGETVEDFLAEILTPTNGQKPFFIYQSVVEFDQGWAGVWRTSSPQLRIIKGAYPNVASTDRSVIIRHIVHGFPEGQDQAATWAMLEFHRFALLDREQLIKEVIEEFTDFDFASDGINQTALQHRFHALFFLLDDEINDLIWKIIESSAEDTDLEFMLRFFLERIINSSTALVPEKIKAYVIQQAEANR